ncbi:MAG: hypothetical protein HY711_01725, partial [Candidatus Melainabacteria bacterium]|nr:hypothetical protein [Candidatus Melainabacteria bacterium]
MEEIDALGRQMLIDRPPLTRGRLTVFRDASPVDDWFPHVTVTLKRSGSDLVLWQWMSHQLPIDQEEPPPYGDEVLLEKYFELSSPIKSPRGLEAVLKLDRGATMHGMA